MPGLLSGAAAPATLLGASPQTPFISFKEVFLQSGPRYQKVTGFSFVKKVYIFKICSAVKFMIFTADFFALLQKARLLRFPVLDKYAIQIL